MNNKIIGIVIGILILGIVIFSGMNNPEMSPSMLNVRDKFESTGLTNPEIIETTDYVDGYEFGPCNPGPNANTLDCLGRGDSHEVMTMHCASGWRSTNFGGDTHHICD